MTNIIHDDFLLETRTARRLYHDYAAGLPIVDYHCHLDACQLAEDHRFESLAELWVTADPYKHRAMRIAGVPERCITGGAAPREKFDAWAATVPRTLGNPLFHWTALELKRYFDVGEMLSPDSADRVWEQCNSRLATPGYSARGLVERAGVECLSTSDRLLDDLGAHARLAASGFKTRVLPSLRGDDIPGVEAPDWPAWLGQLGHAAGAKVDGLEAFQHAVGLRLDEFSAQGCRLADHALDDFRYAPASDAEAARLFARRAAGESLADEERVGLKSAILRWLGREYGRRSWVLQLHVGAQRRTSTRLRKLAGPTGGYATIGRTCDIGSLCGLLDDLEVGGYLPRTIIYPLNPADNAAVATLTGSFAEDGVRGKIQFGPAWWYNDHRSGMRRHLDDQASFGLLWAFVGMTTDSRSLLSMARHEYFRRVLCDFLGARVEAGEFPADEALLGEMVRAIAYENACRWILGQEPTAHE